MKKFLEQGSILRSGECGLDLRGQAGRFLNGPLWQQTGVHHQKWWFVMMKWLPSEPVDQFLSIVGFEHVLNGVLLTERDNSFCSG
jgi:hypothetical protein